MARAMTAITYLHSILPTLKYSQHHAATFHLSHLLPISLLQRHNILETPQGNHPPPSPSQATAIIMSQELPGQGPATMTMSD